jgi:tetratricopeptide (TPR) repeat protein
MKRTKNRTKHEVSSVTKNISEQDITLNSNVDSYYFAAFITLITIIIYLPALRNDFVGWDDNIYVYENPSIRLLNFSFFKWSFTTFRGGNWHPLTWLSHGIDYALWGLKPMGHHLTSVIIHAINTFLVTLLGIRLLEMWKERSGGSTFLNEQGMMIAGAVAGLLFGIHPLHVESVAWVAERKDVLCGLFYLLCILTYLKHVCVVCKGGLEGKSISLWFFDRFYLLSFIFFVLALMSKPMAVSLPLVLLILEWYPLQRIRSVETFRAAFVEKLPFIAFCLIASIVSLSAQKSAVTMMQSTQTPLAARALVSVKALMMYLWQMAMPFNLAPFYPYPHNISLMSFEYLLPIVLVIGITLACTIVARRQKLWLSLWSYYVVTLLPVIGIVQVGKQAMADRYMYLPSLAPFLLVGLVSGRLWSVQNAGLTVKRLYAAIAIALVVFVSFLTLKQIAIWKSTLDLWNYELKEESRRSPIAYNSRGLAFADKGQIDKAIEDYTVAISLQPNDPDAYVNRGIALSKKGQIDQAIENYKVAISLEPDSAKGYLNRGVAFSNKGLYDQGIEDFTAAISLKPDYTEAYVNRGVAFAMKGLYDRGVEDLTKALSLKPDFVGSYINRGNLYRTMGKTELATSDYRKACELGSKEGCDALGTHK